MGGARMRIDFVASQSVLDVVGSLGRTEDVRFSPSNRRLAVAGYLKNRITVFEVSTEVTQNSKTIVLTDATQITSASLNSIHGLDFIDDDKILVANRDGHACIFELPEAAGGIHELTPVAAIDSHGIISPGSVAVIKKGPGIYEALICNNYVHKITRHVLDLRTGLSIQNSGILLKKWLNIPDGICVSNDWVAVSNHNTRAVLLYKTNPSLNASSDPHAILRRTKYPHGVRFSPDDRFILVADGGAPFVNIYERQGSGWRGVCDPTLSVRVLSDEEFKRGHSIRAEGGPKGVDINAMNIIVTTCETQPLAFFDLDEILKSKNYNRSSKSAKNGKNLRVNFELYRGQIRAAAIEALRLLYRRFRALVNVSAIDHRMRTSR